MSNIIKKNTPQSFNPPINFTFIDENISNCSYPLKKSHILYFKTIGIERILNYSGHPLDDGMKSICETNKIQIQDQLLDISEIKNLDAQKFLEWIALNVEDIISQSSHASTLILGNRETFEDCMIIACFRRVQEWSITSTISEFRMLTWPYRLRDHEQLIEAFIPSTVDLVSLSPDFYSIHRSIQDEEKKLIKRHIKQTKIDLNNKMIDPNSDDQARVDAVLYGLLFREDNALISEGIEYDSNLSIVQDKDDDD